MLTSIWTYFESWYRSEDGAALVEYGLLVGLIAVVCIAVLVLLGPEIAAMFQSVVNALPG